MSQRSLLPALHHSLLNSGCLLEENSGHQQRVKLLLIGDFTLNLKSLLFVSFTKHFDVGLRSRASRLDPKSPFCCYLFPTFLSLSSEALDFLILNGDTSCFQHVNTTSIVTSLKVQSTFPGPGIILVMCCKENVGTCKKIQQAIHLQGPRGSFQLSNICFSQLVH